MGKVNKMTNEEATKILKAKRYCIELETSGKVRDCNEQNCDECPFNYEQGNIEEQKKALDLAIKVLEQQPCDDYISREALIKEMKLGYFNKDLQKGKNDPCVIDAMIDYAIRTVKRQPSVIPQSKIGKWIRTRTWEHDGELYCSKCGFDPYDERDCHNFCPNCGAKMESVTPQPKIGHWIIIDDCEQFIAKCSECGRIEDSRMINKYPYCHCGAKMEVTNE